MRTLIKNAEVINEGLRYKGSVLIDGKFIERIFPYRLPENIEQESQKVIDAKGLLLIPGVIDDQVHFREPGLTHKGDIKSESRAAVAGGVTTYMEMPNTNPKTLTQELIEQKFARASEVSAANYSFYLGASNTNLDEIIKTDPAKICGIKVFMGSSTGNMLVDDDQILAEIFRNSPVLIATHCEDEETIKKNIKIARQKYGEAVPISEHPKIRSSEACYISSSKAVGLATKHGARLHLLHLTTEKEMGLLTPGNAGEKQITAEACVPHLWFDDRAYGEKGALIKWNPAIKSAKDRLALWDALNNDKIDIIATDHAPHTIEEKNKPYFMASSGGPMVQHSLVAMFELSKRGFISKEKIVEKMCHAPARLFQIDRRGYIRENYYADLVLVDPDKSWVVNPGNILYKCGWSPLEGSGFSHQVTHTFINGELAFENGQVNEETRGMRIVFNR
jgi:dihydroorotase